MQKVGRRTFGAKVCSGQKLIGTYKTGTWTRRNEKYRPHNLKPSDLHNYSLESWYTDRLHQNSPNPCTAEFQTETRGCVYAIACMHICRHVSMHVCVHKGRQVGVCVCLCVCVCVRVVYIYIWVVVNIRVPFVGPLNIRCRIILRTQKGTQILTTTHIYIDMCMYIYIRGYFCCVHTYVLRSCGLWLFRWVLMSCQFWSSFKHVTNCFLFRPSGL